jgi:hypothetical protein
VASAVGAMQVGGLAQQTGIAAEIRQGNCDEVGDVVAPLAEAVIPEGDERGSAAAIPAASSFTTVPISLEALTASDHAIVVPFPAGDELVACGEIGGTLTEAGALIIGLSPQGDTDISGIAYLSPSPDPTQTTISLFISGEDLATFLDTTFLPPPVIAQEDAARFADVLAARDSAESLAGPFAGTLVQQADQRAVRGAGVSTENFSATVTFVNPQEQTETPWDVGLAFHQNREQPAGSLPSTAQEVIVSSDGFWYYQNAVTGALQVDSQTSFDATPGATNTLDLVVDGTTALFALNGELLARLDLPAPIPSDVFVTTSFVAENVVEAREIVYTGFQVWDVPAADQPAATPTTAAAPDDAARFAAALAARDPGARLAGPFGGTLAQTQGMLGAIPAGITTADFSTTVTFVNPEEQTEVPWDYGFAFHQNLEPYAIQEVAVDSTGLWSYVDFPNGTKQSGMVPTFDPTPGGMNTLDLVVEGSTALFGVNGEFVARLDLPTPVASDVLIATDFFPENIVEGREIIYSTFQVWGAPGTAGQAAATSIDSAHDHATRFTKALGVRGGARSLAGPFAGLLSNRQGLRTLRGAGITAADFSATATFVNPKEQTEAPWDVGFAFHGTQDTHQAVVVGPDGSWSHVDPLDGPQQSGLAPSFDPTPGATNTLDLIVEGSTALFGVNGEFLASINLPSSTDSDVYVGRNFLSGQAVEGRVITSIIYRAFEVWDAPTPASLAAEPPSASAEDDATRFAAALAERDSLQVFGGGPLADTLMQEAGSPTSLVAPIGIEDLSATVAFDNPTEQTATPWDFGFAFHPVDNAHQTVFVDSDGFWYHQGTRAGWVSTFDGTPGVTNTLDLIVEGDTALFGVNGEFVARLDLPTPTTFGIGVVTGLVAEYRVEGRQIGFTLEVWT